MTVIQRIIATAVLWNLCALHASAQTPSPQEAFDQLVEAHSAIAGDNAEVQRTELVAQWVGSNDWQSLPLADKAWLHERLLALDQVDRMSFSVRWTGSISAPTTREYIFSQHCLPGAYGGTLKLWINGQLVLDTTAAPQRLGIGPELAPPLEGAYRGQPVRLVSGEAVSFRVDYVYSDEFPMFVDASHRWRFPLPLLLWEATGVESQIVPRSVFAPPVDFETDETTGLQAEYFNDPEFSASIGAFWEPGVQAIWNKRPVLPRYKQLQETILAAVRNEIVSPSVREDEAADFVRQSFGKALAGLGAADRQAAIESVAAEASLLSHLDIKTFASWMPHVAILPDAPHVELLLSWSELHNVPSSRMAIARGYGAGSYAAANYRYYRETGLWFNGPEWDVAKKLIDEHLERDDGTCNILVSYIVAFSSRYEHSPGRLLRAIEERIDDDSLSADVRATWLWGRSHAEELFVGGLPQPRRAISSLQEALLISEDSNLRFRLFEELVVHLASMSQTEQAASFVAAHADEFQEPDQVIKIADLQSQLTALAQRIAEQRSTLAERQLESSRATRNKILLRRQQLAADRGQDDIAARYEQQLIEEGAESQ